MSKKTLRAACGRCRFLGKAGLETLKDFEDGERDAAKTQLRLHAGSRAQKATVRLRPQTELNEAVQVELAVRLRETVRMTSIIVILFIASLVIVTQSQNTQIGHLREAGTNASVCTRNTQPGLSETSGGRGKSHGLCISDASAHDLIRGGSALSRSRNMRSCGPLSGSGFSPSVEVPELRRQSSGSTETSEPEPTGHAAASKCEEKQSSSSSFSS